MQVIASGRQTGRTTELIRQCAEAEAKGEVSYIVCHSRSEAQRIFKEAEKLGLAIGFPITYGEAQSSVGKSIKNLYVDNAEYFISYMLKPFHVEAITITTED